MTTAELKLAEPLAPQIAERIERAESVIELMRRRRGRVEMTTAGEQLLLEQSVLIEGGVTEEHLRLQLKNWRGFVTAMSAMCRRLEEDTED